MCNVHIPKDFISCLIQKKNNKTLEMYLLKETLVPKDIIIFRSNDDQVNTEKKLRQSHNLSPNKKV